jgi:hypothetical protein
MIKQTVNRYTFHDAFNSMRPDNFNYAGLDALYDYLEQLSDDIGQDIELDVIAICCDFCQYDTVEKACEAYDLEDREELEQHTLVIDCDDDSVIIANF